MASYNIRWKLSAAKELKRLDRMIIPRVTAAVEALAHDPHPSGNRKLQGAEFLWRIRVGDYRVIYSVDDDVLCIEVIKVAPRQAAYRP